MKIVIRSLQKYTEHDPFKFSEVVNLKAELISRYGDQVIDASDFNVSGMIFSNIGDVIVSAHVTGKIVVPSTRSLDPVEVPLDFEIEEYYVLSKAGENRYSKDAVVFVVDEDSEIDTNETIIENVILQIPMQVLTPAELAGQSLPNGNDWNLVTNDSDQEEQLSEDTKIVDPRLAKLQDFFNED